MHGHGCGVEEVVHVDRGPDPECELAVYHVSTNGGNSDERQAYKMMMPENA